MNEISFRVSRRTVWVGTGGAGVFRCGHSQRYQPAAPHRRNRHTIRQARRDHAQGADLELRLTRTDGNACRGIRQVLPISLNYRGAEPARQHQALLEYALARDVARAKSVLLDHVNGCVEHALTDGAFR